MTDVHPEIQRSLADGPSPAAIRALEEMPPYCPLEPLEDRIIAVELPRPDTWSGLHLPDPSGPLRALVVAAGPGRVSDHGVLMPAPARPGDTVLLAEHGPTEVDVDGVTYLTCTPMLVLAVEQ